MKRRLLLAGGALGAAAWLADRRWTFPPPPPIDATVRYPGREAGHRFRDQALPGGAARSSAPVLRRVDVAIVGSGVAGLSCAWALQRAGLQDFVLIDGPAPYGNAAHGVHRFSPYPQGAHYLPVPPRSCLHVRQILQDLDVLVDGVDDDAPAYDERYLVHANVDRVLHAGRWHAGLLPPLPPGSAAEAQWRVVQAGFEQLRQQRDAATGLPVFRVPLVQGARAADGDDDEAAAALDRQSFAQWLDALDVTDPLLRWYFDYCCRDEYGVDASLTSAWAGVHYFCVQRGQARHAEPGTLLTWPQGLGFIAQGLQARLMPAQRLPGVAWQVSERQPGSGHVVTLVDGRGQPGAVHARRVVVAAPLFVARRLAAHHFDGLAQVHGPQMSPWMVANFFMNRFPAEQPGEPLSWDNAVSGSASLGYVVATHQAIRAALPEGTVITAYHALGAADNDARRRWLATAAPDELLALAGQDLDAAYGNDWKRWCIGAELTVHGHAMAIPSPGFLGNAVVQRARRSLDDPAATLLFAHSDLSGYSVFEEAAYWGTQAARRITGAAGSGRG